MNIIQNSLQQIYKEYIELKNYVQESEKNSAEKRKTLAEKSLNLSQEEQIDLVFETIGTINILKIDLVELQKKLYYAYINYKELVEIPEEIVEEIKDFKVKSVYTILNGKLEILDKELYEFYKKQHRDITIQSAKFMEFQNLAEKE